MSMAESQFHFNDKPIVIVMGVSGCGKSTIGSAVAKAEGLPFLDADDFHPRANVDKMAAGIALTDEDRWPWLTILAEAMREAAGSEGGVIAACHAPVTMGPFTNGPMRFSGVIQGARIEAKARSAEWLAARWRNLRDPGAFCFVQH